MEIRKMLHIKTMLEEVEAAKAAGGIIVDVRSKGEYEDGHIPGSINIPVNTIHDIKQYIKSKDDLICLYCESGIRANKAQGILNAHEYHNVKVLGKIRDYKGELEE
ncbi:MAG: rhodanese-like domain-containing protein [Firmicutes bacterium]|nr:rhodanese-like domain-containing protein [Bacillota bacterium]